MSCPDRTTRSFLALADEDDTLRDKGISVASIHATPALESRESAYATDCCATRSHQRRPRDERGAPPGVNAGSVHRLLESRVRGRVDNTLAIDKAATHTSIVFSIDWRCWMLLFAGDAELRSWRTVYDRSVPRPVHILKVSHHGSHDETPEDRILHMRLPATSPDRRLRFAVVSTWPATYGGIPHPPTDARIGARCKLHCTMTGGAQSYVSLPFDSP